MVMLLCLVRAAAILRSVDSGTSRFRERSVSESLQTSWLCFLCGDAPPIRAGQAGANPRRVPAAKKQHARHFEPHQAAPLASMIPMPRFYYTAALSLNTFSIRSLILAALLVWSLKYFLTCAWPLVLARTCRRGSWSSNLTGSVAPPARNIRAGTLNTPRSRHGRGLE